MARLSEHRTMLMGQHAALRVLLTELQSAARGVMDGDASKLSRLKACVGELQRGLNEHLETEERILGPILATVDAWGPVRLERMQAEHAHTRAVLEHLRFDRMPSLAPESIARKASALADDLFAEMVEEETDLLDPNVLRDDTVTADASDA